MFEAISQMYPLLSFRRNNQQLEETVTVIFVCDIDGVSCRVSADAGLSQNTPTTEQDQLSGHDMALD